jgi:hypothetical protein
VEGKLDTWIPVEEYEKNICVYKSKQVEFEEAAIALLTRV